MHAAVWSQPSGHRKFPRAQTTAQVPDSCAGKCILGISILLTLTGGLLLVMGLTGFFVRGERFNKMSLGLMAASAGILSLLTGVSGSRSVSRWETAKKCTNIFTLMVILTTLSFLSTTVLSSAILVSRPPLLLTIVIAIGELILGTLGVVLSLCGLIIVIGSRSLLVNPLGSEHNKRRRNDGNAESNEERTSTGLR